VQRELNGAVVRALRKARGISLRTFAGNINRNPATVSRIETGKCQPSGATMLAIAEALDVDLAVITHLVEVAA
jgi:transcriptional regulator with XRE-family HTH domain